MAVVALSLVAAVASCADEGSSFRPAEGSDGPGPGASGGGGSTPGGGNADGSADAEDDATAALCNELDLDVPIVDGIAETGEPVPGSGGTVVEGTYGLTDYRTYVGTGVPGLTGKSYRAVISIADGILQHVSEEERSGSRLDAGTSVVRRTSSFVTSGTDFVTAAVCPSSGSSEVFSYTATDSRLVLSDLASGEVLTFDLRP